MVGFFFGIYFILLGVGILPRKVKDEDGHRRFREKYASIMTVVGICALIAGVLLFMQR